MPLNIDILQILLHILNFLILAGGLTLLLFKPIEKFLAERCLYFENAAKEIEKGAAENEIKKAEYDKKLKDAEEIIREMRIKAEKEVADLSKSAIDNAKARSNAIIIAAEKEAEDRKEHILDSVQTEIGEIVITATQKLLSDTVTKEYNNALYDEFIRLTGKTITDKRSSK